MTARGWLTDRLSISAKGQQMRFLIFLAIKWFEARKAKKAGAADA